MTYIMYDSNTANYSIDPRKNQICKLFCSVKFKNKRKVQNCVIHLYCL